MPLCSEMYVRQHSSERWSALHRPRKTKVVYIIISTVLFCCEYPPSTNQQLKSWDLPSPFSLSSGPGAGRKSRVKCCLLQAAVKLASFHAKTLRVSKNVEREYKTSQRGTRRFPRNRAISLPRDTGVLGSTGVTSGGLMLLQL